MALETKTVRTSLHLNRFLFSCNESIFWVERLPVPDNRATMENHRVVILVHVNCRHLETLYIWTIQFHQHCSSDFSKAVCTWPSLSPESQPWTSTGWPIQEILRNFYLSPFHQMNNQPTAPGSSGASSSSPRATCLPNTWNEFSETAFTTWPYACESL